jgi:hypothetical protein
MMMTALFALDFDIAVCEVNSTMTNFSNSQEEETQELYDADDPRSGPVSTKCGMKKNEKRNRISFRAQSLSNLRIWPPNCVAESGASVSR